MSDPWINLLKLVISLTIVILPFYLLKKFIERNKITVPCMGCSEGGVFTKCSPGTGKGSVGCEVYQTNQAAIEDIKRKMAEVKQAISEVGEVLMVPINAIKETMAKIGELEFSMQFDMPPMPELQIPEMQPLEFKTPEIDIPDFELGKGLETAVKVFIDPLNTTIGGSINAINEIINGLNQIPGINLDLLQDLTIQYPSWQDLKIDFPKISPIDIGKMLQDGVNVAVRGVNQGIKASIEGINIALKATSDAFKFLIQKLQEVLGGVLADLKKQLDSMNIFKDIIPKITALFARLGELSPLGALQTFLLPYMASLFPGAQLADMAIIIALIGALILLSPVFIGIFTLYTTVSTVYGVVGGHLSNGGGGALGGGALPHSPLARRCARHSVVHWFC